MSTVFIVHCVDTEGPLYEPIEAKFERLRELFGIHHIAPTRENLIKLQDGTLDLGGQEEAVRSTLSSHRTNTFGTWDQVDAMLDRVSAPAFREAMLDDDGRGWIYNWFCVDHVGYDVNPRRRDIGFHNIFDHYRARLADAANCSDEVHWHFHPMSTYAEAHRCATHYLRTDHLYQILARRVIDRQWFPSTFRAGFQAERPDSHWFLEQFIPFDYTNMALDDPEQFDVAIDFRNGRSGDWRRAPADWSVYHPSHDDYQVPGNCRRWIARCLNVMSRIASIDQREMNKAFARASGGTATVVGICSHDFRDLGPEVECVRALIASARAEYPKVKVQFAGALEAISEIVGPRPEGGSLSLDVDFRPGTDNDVPYVEVSTRSGKVFGPQPFMAIKTRSGRYLHDNLDFSPCGRKWFYAFHGDTLPIEDVALFGIAANDGFGSTVVRHLDFGRGTGFMPVEV